jgi:hypothetical protein
MSSIINRQVGVASDNQCISCSACSLCISPDELHRPLSERGVREGKKVTEQLKSEGME